MASLSTTSINRPVLAIVLSLVIILFGVIGYNSLGIREFPSVDPPVVTVSTSYRGASADVIESQITDPLEESINGIAGIRTLSSASRDGSSNITVEFNLDVDMEAAADGVHDKVSRVQNRLPLDADPPTVSKADADGNPIVYVGVKSDKRSLLEISNIASRTIKERLQTIPGVSEVVIWGEKKYAMRLWMDAEKLAAYQLSPQDVLAALNRENVELPGGSVEGKNTELTVRTLGRLESEKDFLDMIIRQEGNSFIRFRDVGTAVLAPENEKTLLKDRGIPMVGVVLIPQPGSNQIAIADEFYKRIENIKKELPPDVSLVLGFDNTEYIRNSIKEVLETILISFGLVVAVIFLFLRNARTTFIPVIAIPISLIGSFFLMYIFGFSINVLTLLGIVLAIGLVVDDAIVVLENIYAKVEAGIPPRQAALEGSNEIYFAVISTTIVLAAVFLPIIFLEGISGRLFREFGVVIAGSVLISAFVSLSLTPMLSSRMLKHSEKQNWFYSVSEPFFVWLNQWYENALNSFFQYRWVAFILIGGSAFLIYVFIQNVQLELAPQEDRNGFRVVATGPEGATFEYMNAFADQASAIVNSELINGEAKASISVSSPGIITGQTNSAFVRVILESKDKRSRSQQEIVDALMPKLANISTAKTFIAQEQSIGGSSGIGRLPLQYVIQSSTLAKLQEVLPKFLEKTKASKMFLFTDANLKFNKPQLKVAIDRDKAKSLGVSVKEIGEVLQLSFSGQRFGYFIKDGKQYQVIGQLTLSDRNKPVDLTNLYVRNNKGELIQLDNVVKFEEISTPPQIYRFNRYVSATVQGQMAKGYTLADGITEMERISKEVLNENYSTSLDGGARDFKESSSSILFSFGLALILIYLILSAQFESFSAPFLIMLTVPLAGVGALGALWYFKQTLNIFSEIGIIMLIGLVTKNGILIVEFANQQLELGLSKNEAVIKAAISRFRPILMTSLSAMLGAVPIALAFGAGAESRVSMGIVIIYGLFFSTILTLFVIPALYGYFVQTPKAKEITPVEKIENALIDA